MWLISLTSVWICLFYSDLIQTESAASRWLTAFCVLHDVAAFARNLRDQHFSLTFYEAAPASAIQLKQSFVFQVYRSVISFQFSFSVVLVLSV